MLKIASGEDAWRYFQSTVADESATGRALDYYAEQGTPVGRWLGTGVDALGLTEGSPARPAELSNLFGGGKHPLTGAQLARRYVTPAPVDERVADRVAALDAALAEEERDAAVASIIAEETARAPVASVAGFELVFNPPKSVSVLWGLASDETRSKIQAAHHQAMQETIAILERDALRTRIGAGGVAQIEVVGAVAAAFDHWDTREGDPHLHTHLLVANRVQAADGRWRTIDSRHGLSPHVVTLSETYDAALMDALSNRLGIEWVERSVLKQPGRYERFLQDHSMNDDQQARALFADAVGVEPRNRKWEIAGIGLHLIEEFSRRSQRIVASKDALIEQFRELAGREPTRFEIWRMRLAATRSTRAAKVARPLEDLVFGWAGRAEKLVSDPAALAEGIVARGRQRLRSQRHWSVRGDDLALEAHRDRVVNTVLASLERSRPTWTRANALAEIHRALKPVTFRTTLDRDDASRRILTWVIERAVPVTPPNPLHVPRQFRQSDGSSVFEPKARQLFTTRTLLAAEQRLVTASTTETAVSVEQALAETSADGRDKRSRPLGADQRAAIVAIATSGNALDVLVGPAGAGKTTTLSRLRAVWEERFGAGSVIGLAPSAAAAQVLGDSLGIATENTAMWITRSSAGHEGFGMRRGQLVIVDEASMSGTLALDELRRQANAAGAKLLLVGDDAQLGSVDAGGAFALIVERRGDSAARLNDVHRFTEEWEREVSLLLRRGQLSAIDAYETRGRIHAGDADAMQADALAAWRRDMDAGRNALLIAPNNATVRALNHDAQAWLKERGCLGEASAPIADGMRAHAGDRIVTRENERMLRDSRGEWVRNGQEWRVERVRRSGVLVVVGDGGARITLPAAYVREHVQLAYAATAHRAQGRTVDTAHMLVSEATTREVLYVGMTRGCDENRLYVAVGPADDDAHRPVERGWRDVLESVLCSSATDVSASRKLEEEYERTASIRQLAAGYETLASQVARDRFGPVLDAAVGRELHAELRGGGAYDALIALMRSADSRGADVGAVVRTALDSRSLEGAVDRAALLDAPLREHLSVTADTATAVAIQHMVGPIEPITSPDPDFQRALRDRVTATRWAAVRVLQPAAEGGVHRVLRSPSTEEANVPPRLRSSR